MGPEPIRNDRPDRATDAHGPAEDPAPKQDGPESGPPHSALGDPDLIRLVRDDPDAAAPAAEELRIRHYPAALAYASLCGTTPRTARALADAACRAAARSGGTREPEEAWRPYLLRLVLRTAVTWADTERRGELSPDLREWIAGGGVRALRAPGTAVRSGRDVLVQAYRQLPARTKTVLWHDMIEREHAAGIARLLGTSADAVRVWSDNGRERLRGHYVQLYEERAEGTCRTFTRLVVAATRLMDSQVASGLDDHIAGCGVCNRAFDDLLRMYDHCHVLLAEGVLPWGGARYLADRVPAGQHPAPAVPGVVPVRTYDHAAMSSGPLSSGPLSSGLPSSGHRLSGHRLSGHRSSGPLSSGPWAARVRAYAGRRLNRSRLRSAVPTPALALAAAASGLLAASSPRTRLLAVVAVSSAVVVLAGVLVVTNGSGRPAEPSAHAPVTPRLPERSVVPASPTPTGTVTATLLPTPTRTAGAPARTSRPGTTAPAHPDPDPVPSRKHPVRPAVPGAAVSWDFAEHAGSTTADGSGNGNTGSLIDSPRRSAARGGSLALDGSTQCVEARSRAVDTDRSFTVAAWVNLAAKGEFATAVGQDGDNVSRFFLQYDASIDRWRLAVEDDDSSDSGEDEAVSRSSPVLGTWAHLAGVYDDAGDEIRLYVNGRLEGRARHTENWPARGAFTVGRGKWEGRPADPFQGYVDDVRAFPRAVSQSEAATLAAG
ncbi:LamG-like jellyroll fold domain-containing protein [Streptomyces sp. NPDC055709]